MKKIFLFLCLLYLTLCENCVEVQNPSKASDCIGKTPSSSSTTCCYAKYSLFVSISHCLELPKGLDTDQIKAELKKAYGETLEDFSCKGSYLKMGLLLLAAFLL